MHVLIAGCGYLGRRAADRWLGQGARVSVITRGQQKADELAANGFEPLIGDLATRRIPPLPPVDVVLWTVGTRIPELVRSLPLDKNERGQIKADATLRTSDPHIFALGDLAESRDKEGELVPSTGQVAIQQADYVAWNVWASLGDRPALEFRYQNLGEMLALGNTEATLAGLGLTLDGPLAYAARRLVYLYRMPSFEHQVKVGLNWLTQPLLKGLGIGS